MRGQYYRCLRLEIALVGVELAFIIPAIRLDRTWGDHADAGTWPHPRCFGPQGHEQTSLHGALGQRLRYVRALAKMAALRSNDDEVRVLGQHEAILLAVADPETGLVLLAKFQPRSR